MSDRKKGRKRSSVYGGTDMNYSWEEDVPHWPYIIRSYMRLRQVDELESRLITWHADFVHISMMNRLWNIYICISVQTGRNIRHLPCVARKTGLKGTCMFAIDCLKSNGTHLGTCIDKFYFGSCCQLHVSSRSVWKTGKSKNLLFFSARRGFNLPTRNKW